MPSPGEKKDLRIRPDHQPSCKPMTHQEMAELLEDVLDYDEFLELERQMYYETQALFAEVKKIGDQVRECFQMEDKP